MCVISWQGICAAFLCNKYPSRINRTRYRILVNVYLISRIKICSIESYGSEGFIPFRRKDIATPGNQTSWKFFRYYPSKGVILVDVIVIILLFSYEHGIFVVSELEVIVRNIEVSFLPPGSTPAVLYDKSPVSGRNMRKLIPIKGIIPAHNGYSVIGG